jgi:hypothetical protein
MLDVGGWREGYPEDVMSSRTTAAAFDPTEWSQKGFTERVRIGTNAYVLQGIGYPLPVYLFHAVKLSLFVLGWMFFCSFTPGLGTLRNFSTWIFEGVAFLHRGAHRFEFDPARLAERLEGIGAPRANERAHVLELKVGREILLRDLVSARAPPPRERRRTRRAGYD